MLDAKVVEIFSSMAQSGGPVPVLDVMARLEEHFGISLQPRRPHIETEMEKLAKPIRLRCV